MLFFISNFIYMNSHKIFDKVKYVLSILKKKQNSVQYDIYVHTGHVLEVLEVHILRVLVSLTKIMNTHILLDEYRKSLHVIKTLTLNLLWELASMIQKHHLFLAKFHILTSTFAPHCTFVLGSFSLIFLTSTFH